MLLCLFLYFYSLFNFIADTVFSKVDNSFNNDHMNFLILVAYGLLIIVNLGGFVTLLCLGRNPKLRRVDHMQLLVALTPDLVSSACEQ